MGGVPVGVGFWEKSDRLEGAMGVGDFLNGSPGGELPAGFEAESVHSLFPWLRWKERFACQIDGKSTTD